MTMEETEMKVQEEEPIYYTPKRLSRISDLASIVSWVVLVGFIGDVIVQIVSLMAQLKSQNVAISTLTSEPSFYSYIFINVVIPLLTGLGLFAILQGVSVGLNVLLDMDYKAHG